MFEPTLQTRAQCVGSRGAGRQHGDPLGPSPLIDKPAEPLLEEACLARSRGADHEQRATPIGDGIVPGWEYAIRQKRHV